MLLGFQTKLKLNNQQKTSMAQHAGFAHWVFNWGLKAWQETYKEGLKPTAYKLKKFYTNHVKPNYPWQNTLSSRVYQYAFADLDQAFKRFFSVKETGIRGMLKNRKLAQAIGELGLYEFRRQLEYKCEVYGSKLTLVDRWFPSSPTCSHCGAIKGELPLSERVYYCECGLEIDRDLNAARVLAKQTVAYTVLACGQSAADGSG